MHTQTACAACLFTALNICTWSARADATVTAQRYPCGTHLDIKHGVSMTQDCAPACGVVNARKTSLDAHDTPRALDDRKFGAGCIGDN